MAKRIAMNDVPMFHAMALDGEPNLHKPKPGIKFKIPALIGGKSGFPKCFSSRCDLEESRAKATKTAITAARSARRTKPSLPMLIMDDA